MVARRRGNPPPRLDAHPRLQPSCSPQQLPLAHVQRKRNVASLGERLAILLPQASLEGPSAPNVVLMPSLHSQRAQKPAPQTAPLSITSHETPEKLQKLSQKLTALLGREPREPSSVAKSKLSSQELLWCLDKSNGSNESVKALFNFFYFAWKSTTICYEPTSEIHEI